MFPNEKPAPVGGTEPAGSRTTLGSREAIGRKPAVTRRKFVRALGAVSGGIVLAGAPLPVRPGEVPASGAAKPVARPKIGCLSWCFHDFSPGTDPIPALDIIGSLGFEGVELILSGRQDIDGLWGDANLPNVEKALERNRLQVSQLVLFQPVVEGLSSLVPEERKKNLDYFEAGCRIAKKLGAPIVNIVAPWPRELTGPSSYLPRYYELKDARPGEKFHIDIAGGFDWDRVWTQFIETTKACLERAKAHGLKFTIEHHTHCIIPDATSFLRLWDAVRDPALGYNMDVGWTLSQREYPPLAIHKVKDHLMNLHMRDIDGLMRSFVLVGEGVMDFKAIADTLKAVGFTGFLSIEQDKYPGDMKAVCRRYLEIMRQCLA